MSQEIQLSSTAAPPGDYWTQGQAITANHGGGPTAPRQSPLRKMHRLLRGRYPLALFLAGVCGLAGAIGGYALITPKFQAEGMIQIDPMVNTPNPNNPMIPMFGTFLSSQTSIIQSPGVAEEALRDPQFVTAWTKAYGNADPMSSADFLLELDAEHAEKNGFNIRVVFTDKNKDVAQAGARAAIAAYMKLHGNVGNEKRADKLDFLDRNIRDLNTKVDGFNKQLAVYGQKYGTIDLTISQTNAQEEVARLETALDQRQVEYDAAANPSGQATLGNENKDFILQQIAANDPGMRELLNDRSKAIDYLQNITTIYKYGPQHPMYQRAQLQLEQAKLAVDGYMRQYLVNNTGKVPFTIADASNSGTLSMLKAQLDSLKTNLAAKKTQANEIEAQRTGIVHVQQQLTQTLDQIHTQQVKRDTIEAEQQMAKNVIVADPGSEAQPAPNKRPLSAVVGFILGGAMPVGLLMLYGMLDLRFRYSDDTAHADLAGVALLGILPNLPDRLSDPQQAGIAAHCVHQIRTMLQINRTNDEPQVLAVTSAAPADGKTSLTLALGLSYAACGARTLLIDCDLVAAGLSHRLNVNSPDGVLEAVANRALLEYVRTTDIADVAILPVGTTHAHHASTLSPVALRRLLNEAKKNFDIVLVDTGPILGSIEASLVCAAADRTILTVARGQQRPLVERSIGHLQAIGSRLAGVVFNRAQPRDFERSLSGLAMRSRSNNGYTPPTNGHGNGHSTPKAAPAVGSFKRSV